MKNDKILLNNELENLDNNIEEVEKKEEIRRKNEIEFIKVQNSNLMEFLEHVKSTNNPLEIKKNFEKKR